MIYLLVKHFQSWLEAHGLQFVRVFTDVTFQATMALVVAFVACVSIGPRCIRWLRRMKIGDQARFDQAELDRLMEGKRGVPTMGGLFIIASIALTSLLVADMGNFYVDMAMICLIWLGAVGATDDWLKLTAGRRAGSRQGLTSAEKLLFQVGLSILLAVFTYLHGSRVPEATQLFFPFAKRTTFIQLNVAVYVAIAAVVMTGTSNAVNLTDGLDGLAAGCMGIVSFTFLILSLVVGIPTLANFLRVPYIHAAGQMAVVAGAMTGACVGFLWFNCHPAQVFMGDTGSLALGGLIGYIAIVIRHELVLLLAGGVFVIEAVSVILQVTYFKYSRRRFGEGRRIFLMAPLHHHFQRKGWTETQVVVRFWLIGAMLSALALATVKLR